MPNLAVRVLARVWTHRWFKDVLRSHTMWWLNSKFAAGVTAIIRDADGRILLVEHAFRRRYPWALPGGWMNRGESPEQALVREVHEETGLTITIDRIVAAHVFDLPRIDIAYACHVVGGTMRPSAETPRWQWCRPDELPEYLDPGSAALIKLSDQSCAPASPLP